MLRVRVVIRGRLLNNSRIQQEGADVTLPEGGRVRDILPEVGVFDEEVREIVVNGRRGRLDQSLRRNDSVELRG
jgi:hypothetical protein